MVRLGMMSFAHLHAYSYAQCINQLPGVSLEAIWDDSPKRGKEAAEQFNSNYVKNLDELLNSSIEGVVICSENSKHREMVEAAAKAGKWILCEKPLATTIKDATAMVEACKRAGVGLGTAFPCRYVPALIEAQHRIAAGELGDIYAVSCTNNGSYPGGWFSNEELSGGGAVMDHTVHVADVLRWFTGKEFTKVYCEKGTLIRRNLNTDDVGSIHLEMQGGTKVAHVASWSRCDSFPTWGDVTFDIIGEKGVMSLDAFGQKLDVYSDKTVKPEWVYWGDDPNLALISDFTNAVAEKRPPSVSGLDGLRAVEVTVAAYRSAQSGKMEKVP